MNIQLPLFFISLSLCSCLSDTSSYYFSNVETGLNKSGLPTYFMYEMEETILTVNSLANEGCLVLNILSDNHLGATEESEMTNEETIQNLRYFNQHVNCDGVVHLGDIIDPNLQKRDGLSDDSLYSIIGNYADRINSLNSRVFFVNGNHDGEKAVYFNRENWRNIIAPLNESYVYRDDVFIFFYYDYTLQHVRLVFLSLPEGSNIKEGFSINQLTWLNNTAFRVEDGINIILFAHIPENHANYMSEGRMPNISSFEGLCNAFNAHSNYSDNIITADFSNLKESKILAYIAGHAHCDLIQEPGWVYSGQRIITDHMQEEFTYVNNLPFPIIIIGANRYTKKETYRAINGGMVFNRRLKTSSQDLWDTMIYDPRKRCLHFIRFGAGEDRHISLSNLN